MQSNHVERMQMWSSFKILIEGHFQQYFSYIVAVSFIGGGPGHKDWWQLAFYRILKYVFDNNFLFFLTDRK
jgi:hypothetical protein